MYGKTAEMASDYKKHMNMKHLEAALDDASIAS